MIFVAIGANLPDRGRAPAAGHLPRRRRGAAQPAGPAPGRRCRRWYRTAPVPPPDQPDYVNGVARLEGEADAGRPAGLAAGDRGAGGRVARRRQRRAHARSRHHRPGRPGARPHPTRCCRIRARICAAFVLLPAARRGAGLGHPVLGRTAATCCAALPPQDIARSDGLAAATAGPPQLHAATQQTLALARRSAVS